MDGFEPYSEQDPHKERREEKAIAKAAQLVADARERGEELAPDVALAAARAKYADWKPNSPCPLHWREALGRICESCVHHGYNVCEETYQDRCLKDHDADHEMFCKGIGIAEHCGNGCPYYEPLVVSDDGSYDDIDDGWRGGDD